MSLCICYLLRDRHWTRRRVTIFDMGLIVPFLNGQVGSIAVPWQVLDDVREVQPDVLDASLLGQGPTFPTSSINRKNRIDGSVPA
jgi:hypothetical protein